MDNHINMTNKWKELMKLNTKDLYEDRNFKEVMDEMDSLFNGEYSTDKVKSYIKKIFYSEDKKSKTTIRNYFGCNVGETPKAIIILSEDYTKKLINNKNVLESYLKELKSLKNRIIDFQKEHGNVVIEEKRVPIEKIKKILSNINYFNNINYSFFLEALKVRRKVAKYITKAVLGEKITEQIEAGIASGKPFKINTYYSMDFEQWRDIKDEQYDIDLPEGGKARIVANEKLRQIIILVHFPNNYSKLYDKLKLLQQIYPSPLFGSLPIKMRQGKEHFEFFKEIQSIFKLKYDITKFTTCGNNGHSTIFKQMFTGFQQNVEKAFKDEIGELSFLYIFFYNIDKYVTNNNDKLYHSSEKILKECTALTKGLYTYTESRVYFGANIPMTPDGYIHKNLKGRRIYLMNTKPNETIYKDPEHHSNDDEWGQNEREKYYGLDKKELAKLSSRTACYICNMNIELEDVTDFFMSKPEYI